MGTRIGGSRISLTRPTHCPLPSPKHNPAEEAMSESSLDFDPVEAEVPVRSGWRRAVLAFAALGAGAYAFGRLAARDTSGTIPAQLMMLTTTLGPILALLGFGAWW